MMSSSDKTSTTQSTPETKMFSQPKKLKSQLFIPLNFETSQAADDHINMTRYVVYFHHDNSQAQVVLELLSTTTIYTLIEEALVHFAQDTPELKQSVRDYELYIAKKNGAPKTDYPSFSYDQILQKTKNQCFSLAQKLNEVDISSRSSDKKDSIILEKSNKRKYTDSPQRCKVSSSTQCTYVNSLTNIESNLNKKIDDSKNKKRTKNWFFSLLGCGCDQNKYGDL